jgi:hypothetical protein
MDLKMRAPTPNLPPLSLSPFHSIKILPAGQRCYDVKKKKRLTTDGVDKPTE